MSDKKHTGLPFDSDNAAESEIWNALGEFPDDEPSSRLRQGFYSKLEQASRPSLLDRLRELLGFSNNGGWLTATACVLLGLGAGQILDRSANDSSRLAALERNVTMLNRNLILDRLENETASKRLRGVMDAAYVAGNDSEIADALLRRATDDRVSSIRSAAIRALGEQINSPTVGTQLMGMLQQTESPLVQMALVDLVLRNGTDTQINELRELAMKGQIHPDIASHVRNSLERDLI